MEFNHELQSRMRSTVEQIERINEFENQVIEIAKKFFISRKNFHNDVFTGAIKQALYSVTNQELAIVQAEFLSSIPKPKGEGQ